MQSPTLIIALSIVLLTIATATTSIAQRVAPQRDQAGVFDYYTLVLSWSPTHCEIEGDDRRDLQCRRRAERPYAFVLHGLWPQYERGFPERCDIGRRPFVPDRVISAMLDIMPARGLVIHQYRKHGTCSGLPPRQYFGAARKLFEFIKIPDRYVAPRAMQFVSRDEVIEDFLEVNPGLRRDMIAVSCTRRRNARLREVKICFTPNGQLRACGHNERKSRQCRSPRMSVPPVRFRR